MNKFQKTLRRENAGTPPVWFMRQAGRYHSHYQELKKKYSFLELCKLPDVARETTMGPIRDFGFDAAILFSDLLFPLEVMGMGLRYEEGPKLDWHLKSKADLSRLDGRGASLAAGMQYQHDAMKLIRAELPKEKGLIGFVGGPLTLFFYAVEGSHQGALGDAHEGMKDGRYEGFCEKLIDLLAENMAMQARGGADTVAILDTCAGEVSVDAYRRQVVPALRAVIERFHQRCPGVPVVYYSKKTGPAHWDCLEGLPIAVLGVDWNVDLADTLERYGDRYGIQGNIDPHWLFLETDELERRVRAVYERVQKVPASKRRGWVAGLGHGVLPKTPEAHVRLVVQIIREMFPESGNEVKA